MLQARCHEGKLLMRVSQNPHVSKPAIDGSTGSRGSSMRTSNARVCIECGGAKSMCEQERAYITCSFVSAEIAARSRRSCVAEGRLAWRRRAEKATRQTLLKEGDGNVLKAFSAVVNVVVLTFSLFLSESSLWSQKCCGSPRAIVCRRW